MSDTITSITEFLENCNAPDILNPYSSSSNHPHLSVISSIHHNPIPSEDKINQPLITADPYKNEALSICGVGVYETVIAPFIVSMRNKSL